MDPFIASAIRDFISPRIQHLTLFVTQKCNIRCRTCFLDFDTPVDNELSLEEIRRIRETLGRLALVNIGGGEPFLREDLAEIVSVFSDARSIGIPTNGWYAEKVIGGTREILKAIAEKQLGLMISVDGFEKTHDFIRAKGSFRRAIETLRRVREEFPGVSLQVNTVLCRYNSGEVLDLIDFVKEYRPSHHSIFLLRGEPRDEGCALPGLEDMRALLPRILDKLKTYRYNRRGILSFIAANYQRYMLDLSLRILEEKRQLIPCRAGRTSLVVYADGSVAPCELLEPCGNIRRGGLAAVLESEEFRRRRKEIELRKCYCTHNCNMVENILFDPRNYLRLLGLNIGGY